MVIPFGAPKVAHLVDQGLEPVVLCLWLLSLVEDESIELVTPQVLLRVSLKTTLVNPSSHVV
jgi:hypothetical protein